MAYTIIKTRRFTVRAVHEDVHHGHVIVEDSFEAAAIAYVEHLPAGLAQRDVTVVVHELETGHEHHFHLRLDPTTS